MGGSSIFMDKDRWKKHWRDYRAKKLCNEKARRRRLRKIRKVGFVRRVEKVLKYKIEAPRMFSIEDNYDETMQFFKRVIDVGEKRSDRKKLVKIISRDVEKLSESSLIYLYALTREYHSDRMIFSGDYPKCEAARLLYQNIGFVKGLKYEDNVERILLSDSAVLYRGKDTICEFAKEVVDSVKMTVDVDSHLLYESLIELMGNTVEHAYVDECSTLKRSWQMVLYKRKTDVIVVFLDIGKGIPNTVRHKFFRDILSNDADLLESAFKGEYRSRTGEYNRGRGLPQIKEFMDSNYVMNTFVCSSSAVYDSRKSQFFNKKFSLRGTLFSFMIGGIANG